MNPTIEFVTTFSVPGYLQYGQQFIDSFVEHCSPEQMTIYHESQGNIDIHPRLVWRNLDDLETRKAFLKEHGSDPVKIGSPADFNGQSIKFCHKVFAIHDAYVRSEADVLVWVDSDVVWHANPDMDRVLPDDKLLAYLGRDPSMDKHWRINGVWRPICTETGFVAYRIGDRRVGSLIDDMASYYTTGEIYTRPKTDWHDAKAFDVVRERSAIPEGLCHNMSEGLGWPPDVWPRTILSDYAIHNKGVRRKGHGHARARIRKGPLR